MKTFNIGLILLSVAASVSAFEPGLRGGDEDQANRGLQTHGFNEKMGSCTGAACGLWGDPHMVTCDGMGYDCQAIGTVNIMNNHMWQVQGQYVDVGAHEHTLVEGWGLTEGASLTNDIVMKYKADDSIPVMQFGFGDLSTHDGKYLSERGCTTYEYYNPTNMPGQGRTTEVSIRACRKRCEDVEGCTSFSWWYDNGCHLNSPAQSPRPSPRNWPRAVRGTLDSACGTDFTEEELADPEEAHKHGGFGNHCPLLYHEDGELVDISSVGRNGYYFGGPDADHYAQNINNHVIRIAHKLEDGSWTEVHLIAKGAGPGELWSCHFDFYICLPASQQAQFMEGPGTDINQGLLGTPDGNMHNDFFLQRDSGVGTHIDNTYNNWHKTLIEYCHDNQCVEQGESIFTPPHGQTFDDTKCENKEYIDFSVENDSCVLTARQIIDACVDMPPLVKHACELDCCLGGCNEIAETVEELTDLKELSAEPKDILYDELKLPPAACEDETFQDTSSTVCPGTDVVKLLKTHGTEAIPDESDIFYGIKVDSGDDNIARTVKFRINNPFPEDAHVYVKYEKSVMDAAFQDPKCDTFIPVPAGCDNRAAELEVACKDYDNITPFALVSVYFASESISGVTPIDRCCDAEDYEGMGTSYGIVEYTFEIECTCPETETAIGR